MDSRYFGLSAGHSERCRRIAILAVSVHAFSLAATAKGERRDQEYVSFVTLCMEGV